MLFIFLSFNFWGWGSGACYRELIPCLPGDPKIFELMSIWGPRAQQRWPIGVVWFATFLVFLGTSYGTKRTYRSAICSFEIIYALLNIKSPFIKARTFPSTQVDDFMAHHGLLQGDIDGSRCEKCSGGRLASRGQQGSDY